MSADTLDSEQFLEVPKRKISSMGELASNMRAKQPPKGHPPFTSTQSLIPDRMKVSEYRLAERKRLRQRLKKPKLVISMPDQKTGVYPYVKRVASSSNVHGVKEMMAAKTIQARIFWILVCAFCSFMACYEIFMIFRTYQNDRIATRINLEQQDVMQYPTVLFCPTHWVSRQKIEKYNISTETLQYVFHYLGDALSVSGDEATFGYDAFDHDREDNALHGMMDKYNFKSVADMFQKISINFFDDKRHENSFKTTLCRCCKKETRTVKATLSGACALIELCASSLQTHNLPSVIHIKTKDHFQNVSTPTPSATGREAGAFIWIYDNRSQIGIQSHNTIFVKENWAFVVKMTHVQVLRKSIGNGKRRCKKLQPDEKYLPMTDCELKCVDKFRNYFCFNCSKFSFFEENPKKRQCDKYKMESAKNGIEEFGGACVKNTEKGNLLHDYVKDNIDDCKRNCIQPCTQYYYEVHNVLRMQKTDNMIQVRFYFETFAATVMRDIETLTIDTLVSSIGGQTGLWLGASVVSVCQIISYCCCPCLHWKDIKKGYDSFRSTFKGKRKMESINNNDEKTTIENV